MGSAINTLSQHSLLQMTLTNVKAALFADAGDIALVSGNEFTSAERTGDTYALPLPEELAFSYDTDWSVDEQNSTQRVFTAARTGEDFMSEIRAVANRTANNVLRPVGQRDLMRQVGYTADPNKEVYFNAANNRTFSFTWKFAPKNVNDANFAQQFYDWLYTSSQPTTGARKGLIGLPDLFQPSFISDLKIPPITLCACTNVTMSLSEGGAIRFHKDGFPAFTSVSANFTEIEIKTKTTESAVSIRIPDRIVGAQ